MKYYKFNTLHVSCNNNNNSKFAGHNALKFVFETLSMLLWCLTMTESQLSPLSLSLCLSPLYLSLSLSPIQKNRKLHCRNCCTCTWMLSPWWWLDGHGQIRWGRGGFVLNTHPVCWKWKPWKDSLKQNHYLLLCSWQNLVFMPCHVFGQSI